MKNRIYLIVEIVNNIYIGNFRVNFIDFFILFVLIFSLFELKV